MRTTLNLDPELMREVKQTAARTGRTIGAVVEDLLRESLGRAKANRGKRHVKLLVSSHALGLQPGVDLDNSASLLDILDSGDDTD